MDKSRRIKKVPEYPVEKISEKSNLLIRGLQELGLSTKVLKLISDGDILKIMALDGARNIESSKDIFGAVVSVWEDSFLTDESNKKTYETEILVYELARDNTTLKMFGSLNENLKPLCLTQDQIIEYINKYKQYKNPLHKNIINMFLFESNNKFFRVWIIEEPNGSMMWVDCIAGDDGGNSYPAAGGHFRIVVPK